MAPLPDQQSVVSLAHPVPGSGQENFLTIVLLHRGLRHEALEKSRFRYYGDNREATDRFDYIDNWSLKLDFEILMKTIPAVLRGSGAS